MNDSLRDRIAGVLDKHYPQTTGYHDELTDWCQCGLRRDHVADAVIAVLLDMPITDLITLLASRPDILKDYK